MRIVSLLPSATEIVCAPGYVYEFALSVMDRANSSKID